MGGRIEPPQPVGAIAPLEGAAPAKPIARASPPTDPSRAEPPVLTPSTSREIPQSPLGLGPVRHERLPSSNRKQAGSGAIYRMDVDLYEGRIAFLSREGPPLRGYVDTDLDPGAYTLDVDTVKKRWVIAEAVKPGLRFKVTLDGPSPFTLKYEQPLILAVQAGLQSSSDIDSVADVIATLDGLTQERRWLYLMGLSDVLLEDVIDQLWSGETMGKGLVMDLLSNFPPAVQEPENLLDVARVLRAIEGFTVERKDLFVDAFTSYMVDPSSKDQDPDRQPPLSTLQIRFTFGKWPPVRSIVLYGDDILEGDRPDPDPPTYGAANLTYPKWLNRITSPRIYAAKKAVLERLGSENLLSIIEQAHEAFEEIQLAWTIYGIAQPLIAGLASMKSTPDKWAGSVGAARAKGAPWRFKGIQPASGGPGYWGPDFEGAANMSVRSLWYQLQAAGTPPGWGYRCCGLQFENFINGLLVDAKDWAYWGRVGRSMRGFSDSEIALSKLEQAERQLRAASRKGVGVEWRVSSGELVPTIRKGLAANGLSQVQVVHVPVRPPPPGWTPKVPTRLF